MHHYIRMRELTVAPFNKKIEAFKGYQLDIQKAFANVEPQILLNLDPIPQTRTTKYFLEKMGENQLEVPKLEIAQKPAASGFASFLRFK